MFDENDRKEIMQIVKDAIKTEISPKLNTLLSFQKQLPDKLNQETRVKELEHEIMLLKRIIHKQSKDLQQLKRGQTS